MINQGYQRVKTSQLFHILYLKRDATEGFLRTHQTLSETSYSSFVYASDQVIDQGQ